MRNPPPHGTRSRYAIDKCHCPECTAANTMWMRQYTMRLLREKHGAVPSKWVDAGAVRAYVQSLQEASMGWRRVAAAAGVPQSSMSKLLYGSPLPVKMLRAAAERILAVRVHPADGAYVDATGSLRRLRALSAAGWPMRQLAARLGITQSNYSHMLWAQRRVTAGRARQISDLYEQLWDRQPDQSTHHARVAVSRARNRARANGWPPPQAWDDETIDDPNAAPGAWVTVDEGAPVLDLDEVEHLAAGGCSLEEIARRMGVTVSAIEKRRLRTKQAAAREDETEKQSA